MKNKFYHYLLILQNISLYMYLKNKEIKRKFILYNNNIFKILKINI